MSEDKIPSRREYLRARRRWDASRRVREEVWKGAPEYPGYPGISEDARVCLYYIQEHGDPGQKGFFASLKRRRARS